MLNPSRVGGGAAGDALTIDLDYTTTTGVATDLTNIEAQKFMRDVIHEVQTKESIMRPYVTRTVLKGTFEWRFITVKRDPLKRQKAIPDLNPRKQTFTAFGITVNPYDDDTWLVEHAEKFSQISIQMETAKASEMGFERLFDKMAFSAMLVDVRNRTTSQWKQGAVATGHTPLPNGNFHAWMKQNKVVVPEYSTLVKMGMLFWSANMSRRTKICAALTPRMLEIIYAMTEFRNKDYIFHKSTLGARRTIDFAEIQWVYVTPEVAPGGYLSSKYITKNASMDGVLATADDSTGVDLSPSNHEVIPFWVKENVYVGECPQLDLFSVFPVPSKRGTPVMIRTKWLGASRAQNKLQHHLIIPTGTEIV